MSNEIDWDAANSHPDHAPYPPHPEDDPLLMRAYLSPAHWALDPKPSIADRIEHLPQPYRGDLETLAYSMNHRDHLESGTPTLYELSPEGQYQYRKDAFWVIITLYQQGWRPQTMPSTDSLQADKLPNTQPNTLNDLSDTDLPTPAQPDTQPASSTRWRAHPYIYPEKERN